MSKLILTRRHLLRGLGVTAGGVALAGCNVLDGLTDHNHPVRNFMEGAEDITFHVQRMLLGRDALAREFDRSEIRQPQRPNGVTSPPDEDYRTLAAGAFADYHLFVGGLVELGAPLDAIWAYELRNEHFFESNLPPFGLEGEVTTANGETYELGDPEQVRAMLDDGRAHWARTLAIRIKELDPTALVTVGFFTSAQGPAEIGAGGDRRLVDPRPVVAVDEIDFIDFREYPGMGPAGWDELWTNSFLDGRGDKPILLGEFGAFYLAYDTIEEAITAHTVFMGRACDEGLDGYLGWVWSNQGLYDETWDAVAEGGAIAAALSPAALPDPCDPPPPATGNLAYERPATASSFEDTDEFYAPPRNAVDGSEATWWTGPDEGPQWIEVDLGAPASIDRIRMITEVGADTPLVVEVSLLDADRNEVGSRRLETTEAARRLDLDDPFDAPVDGVRYVRATTFREGWAIWHELEVYGER